MGKVRAKTIGDETAEKKEALKAAKRKEARSARSPQQSSGQAKVVAKSSSPVILNESEGSQSDVIPAQAGIQDNRSRVKPGMTEKEDSSPMFQNDTEAEIAMPAKGEARDDSSAGSAQATPQQVSDNVDDTPKPQKKKIQKIGKKKERSKKYKASLSFVEKSKTYSLAQALELVDKTHMATFDETVELHVNTTGPVNGSITLPHGTGKQMRVAIFAPLVDALSADALLKKIEAGKIEFDLLVATPDAMPKLAKVARILGPKGLMPNPKNGTVTTKPDEIAKKYEGGHMTFKTESVAPVLHLTVGKLSFGHEKLTENIHAMLAAIKVTNIKNITVKSTMSPGIKLLVK